ncbi:hypothetical protein ORI98_06195 [Shewanella sp. ULN5]|uniref:hypothetical protein n=1 Tax=Shewanella sp. ULN5 TaxID=2994678 RepID=UPI00273D5ABF|nr:hypothetical protein [Shewanella sp. ULN5]MDP5146025.1 hypothetical protein [Shewanella sp. ULN5]
MSIQHSAIKKIQLLVQSELSDFFSGLEQIGEPTNAKEMNQALQQCIQKIFEEAEAKWFSHPSKNLVWITREEFNNSLALQEMSAASVKALMNFATSQSIAAKEDAMNAFSINDLTRYNSLNLDYLNWNGLSTACLNEVNLRGKA